MAQQVIGFHFTLKNKAGDVLDRTAPESPLSFLEGSGAIIEGLEEELSKMSVGETAEVIVLPEKGYGFRDESQVDIVSKSRLPSEEINVGDFFQAGSDQHAPVVRVVQVDGDDVTLDANHPLAGVDLFFDVEVIEKRPATPEEISHGHVHDQGGCCGGGGNNGCGCH
ncbi:MAG: peptidylprolyl isomerase [Verrucomicrobiota bacterium]|nr:peptidylprolyl isomerase [Verrucomicrobiota bacterium]